MGPPFIPDQRSRRVLVTDMWDREDWELAYVQEPKLGELINRLCKESEGAPDLIGDEWASLYRGRPVFHPPSYVRDDRQVHFAIMEALMSEPGYEALHDLCIGDLVGTTKVVLDWEEKTKQLLRQLAEAQKAFEELQKARDSSRQGQTSGQDQDQSSGQSSAQGGEQSQGEGHQDQDQDQDQGQGSEQGPDQDHAPGPQADQQSGSQAGSQAGSQPGQQPDAQSGSQPGQQALLQQPDLQALEAQARQKLNNAKLGLKAVAKNMIESATTDMQAQYDLAYALGAGDGEGALKHMDFAERQRLARLLDNPHFREIARWFGPMQQLARPHEEPVEGLPEEITGLRRGTEPLGDLVPEELALLDDPDLALLFWRAVAEEDLALWAFEGSDAMGNGGLVVCIDSSGSMSGTRDAYAKAAALVLFGIAKRDHRPFRVIHFDASVRDVQDFRQMSMAEAVRMATQFYGGGTRFVPPLTKAVEFLEAEAAHNDGYAKSDIVFITDGEPQDLPNSGGRPTPWLQAFHERLHKVGGTVWGLAVQARPSHALAQITEGKIVEITELTKASDANIKPLRKMFDAVAAYRRATKAVRS